MLQTLFTEAGTRLPECPLSAYPRPRMVRKDWLCLNGQWDFSFWKKGMDGREFPLKITVPYCPESPLSGIGRTSPKGTVFTYRRMVTIPEDWQGKRILLHFGAVDQACTVTVNNEFAGGRKGGYLPFTLDITEFLRPGENELIVRAVDDLSHRYPWGKQKRKRGGMWYTPVSGIWQTVWLEPVPREYIRNLRVESDLNSFTVMAEGISEGRVLFNGNAWPLTDGRVTVPVESPVHWTPETPRLYEFTVESGEDSVASYCALRTLETKTVDGIPRLCLNGKPYFFHGLLDQGYWSDGLYTPPSDESYAEDILAMKALGFNMLRKHIKIEAERYYYACDRLGMAVFQDMVNNGGYSFLFDTALPTVGLQKKPDWLAHPSLKNWNIFMDQAEQTIAALQSHPCICCWTIFNEAWGQFQTDKAYRRLKALDPTRFFDSASGWFAQKESDVESLHIYFKPLALGKKPLPQFLSEFGGYAYPVPGHCANPDKIYGYKKFTDREAFRDALRKLYLEEVLPLLSKGLCAAVYTEVSDIEDETNGLLTYDRRVCKLLPEEFLDVSRQLRL